MKAITLRRPWAYAVSHLGKDIENRNFKLRCVKPGEWLAIHAGAAYEPEQAKWIEEVIGATLPPKSAQPMGIVAVAKFERNITFGNDDPEIESDWFIGPVGWKFSEIVAIPPVDIPGKQGLWTVPENALNAVRRGWRAAKDQPTLSSANNRN